MNKITVRKLLSQLVDEEIPTQISLWAKQLVLTTAPIWSTLIKFIIQPILFVGLFLEFILRYVLSARFRTLRKEYTKYNSASNPVSAKNYFGSPVIGRFLKELGYLHGRYVCGRLQSDLEEEQARRRKGLGFCNAFGLFIEKYMDLDELATRVDTSIRAGCREVRDAEKRRYQHEVRDSLSKVRDMVSRAIQYGLWPKSTEFVVWIKQVNKGKIEDKYVLTYYFCQVDGTILPVPGPTIPVTASAEQPASCSSDCRSGGPDKK